MLPWFPVTLLRPDLAPKKGEGGKEKTTMTLRGSPEGGAPDGGIYAVLWYPAAGNAFYICGKYGKEQQSESSPLLPSSSTFQSTLISIRDRFVSSSLTGMAIPYATASQKAPFCSSKSLPSTDPWGFSSSTFRYA